MSKAHILLVEDDKNLAFILQDYLEMSGYKVDHKSNGSEGINFFRKAEKNIDICILDIMMPLKDGFTLAEEIRRLNENVPIIFLSAKNMKEDKVKGFKVGADDYITKPFSTELLVLKIEAILKRSKKIKETEDISEESYMLGTIKFDVRNQVLISEKGKRSLTKKEAAVLHLLCKNQNKLLKREVALKKIWGEDDYFMGRSMDVYITKLRKYLKNDQSVKIINVHGTGFMLELQNNEDKHE